MCSFIITYFFADRFCGGRQYYPLCVFHNAFFAVFRVYLRGPTSTAFCIMILPPSGTSVYEMYGSARHLDAVFEGGFVNAQSVKAGTAE